MAGLFSGLCLWCAVSAVVQQQVQSPEGEKDSCGADGKKGALGKAQPRIFAAASAEKYGEGRKDDDGE